MTSTFWCYKREGIGKHGYMVWNVVTAFPTEEEAEEWVKQDPKNRKQEYGTA